MRSREIVGELEVGDRFPIAPGASADVSTVCLDREEDDAMTPGVAGARPDIADRLRFEKLLADLSAGFVHIAADRLDGAIRDAQRRVCESLGLDMSTLWQWSVENPYSLRLTHVYRPLGGPPIPEPMDALEYFPWIQHELVAGRIVCVSSLDELPAEAARDRESIRHFGIRSFLDLPLSAGSAATFGAVTFSTTSAGWTWPETMVLRLQLVAQVFANALAGRRSDERLRESEERLKLAADSASVGLWSLDLGSGRYWLTDSARALCGFAADDVVTFERFLGIVAPEDREAVRRTVEEVLRSGGESQVEYRIVLPDGSIRWIFSRGGARCDASGVPSRLMGVSSDVTARRQAESAARDLSHRLIRAHEEERARLARDLHDDVTQRLAVMAIETGRALRGVQDADAKQAMLSVRDGLVRLSEDVHALSYRLHPSVLEDLGLAEALRGECERFTRREPVEVVADVDDLPDAISPDTALAVLRIAQEALRNVARHARAQRVEVRLQPVDDGLRLVVRDDGAGFDRLAQRARHTLGLASMRERVELLGGDLDVDSAPGRGTTVLAWLPLAAGAAVTA